MPSLNWLICEGRRYTPINCCQMLMSWRLNGLAPWKPVRTVVFADKKVFFWIKRKLGLSEYQMAALVWMKGLVIGVLLGAWLF